MAIAIPQTFSDWYWKNSVEAVELRAENIEKSLSPTAKQFVDGIPNRDKLPSYIQDMLSNLSNPSQPDWDNCLIRFVSNIGNAVIERVLGHEVKEYDYHMNEYLHNTLITPDIANILRMRGKITDELWKARQLSGGFSEIEGTFVYESQKPYPAIQDIISYVRYNINPDNPKSDVLKYCDISDFDWNLWDWTTWQKPTLDQVLELRKRNIWNDSRTDLELKRLGWQNEDISDIKRLGYSIPNAQIMLQGDLLGELDSTTIIKHLIEADISPEYAKTYVDGVMTKPATQDMIAYMLRKDTSLTNISKELRKLGIHQNYVDVYKELAYEIPPIQDIITMAVREAFTPTIANKFGQYEDLPQEFVTWAAKKGLTKEWAERYWAAHWNLPSPQQGFEMLQRGIITKDELSLLLRALDVMPFWRDKLIQVAYQPLTRVDVRRMFDLGTLNQDGVIKAYKDAGYNEENAKLMTDFTVKYVNKTKSGIKTTDIITAIKNNLLDTSTARSLLSQINITGNAADNLINAAEHKREWNVKTQRINAIENLYKKERINYNEAENQLRQLNLPNDYIYALLQQWLSKQEEQKVAYWTTTQTLSFLKSSIINESRAREELQLLGYSSDRIEVYIKSVTNQTE